MDSRANLTGCAQVVSVWNQFSLNANTEAFVISTSYSMSSDVKQAIEWLENCNNIL